MATKGFYKTGAEERHDQLVYISRERVLLIFGYNTDSEGNGYNWRKDYDHMPTLEELKTDVHDIINQETNDKIVTGYEWKGTPVYLSMENQINFKAAYDLCVQFGSVLGGALRFKLSEDANGEPLYYTFTSIEELTQFYTGAVTFINETLNEGWEHKEKVDWDALLATLDEGK